MRVTYSWSLTYFAEYISNRTSVEQSKYFRRKTPILDLNIKVIGSDVHTSVYDKRDDFGFPITNFPWLSGDVPRLRSCGVYISQLVRFARCCTSIFDFYRLFKKISSNHFQTTDTGLQISQASKNIWKVLQVILWAFYLILWNIVSRICFWRNLSPRR